MPYTTRIRKLWAAPDLGLEHHRREHRVCLVVGVAMVLIGLAWGTVFSLLGLWLIVAMDTLLVLGGAVVLSLTVLRRRRAANVVIFSSLFVLVVGTALLMDPPSAVAPRSTHLYLLPLAVAALVTFQDEKRWLRYSVVCVYSFAFVALAVTTYTPLPEYAVPDHIRLVGGWGQAMAAIAAFFVLIHVLRTDASARSELEAELLEALALKQFELHYQPQVDIQGHVVGAEALLRWRHPTKGMVMPGHFIHLAEQSGLIVPIGKWVLETACAQLQTWAAHPVSKHWSLAVNISQRQVQQEDFVHAVKALLARHQVQPNKLELELTETILVHNFDHIKAKMRALVEAGVQFSLDDFGTGYSSLTYLQRLPLAKLKIDQSFVADVLSDEGSAAIVRMVLALGTSMKLKVIAEGVETREQHQFLVDNGCMQFQGYLFNRALPPAEMEAWAEQPSAPSLQ